MSKISSIYFLILIIFSTSLFVPAQTLPQQKIENKSLQLIINTVEKRFCSKSELVLRLNLTFTNIGNIPVILDKNSNLIWQYIIRDISKKPNKKGFEQKITPFVDLLKVIKIEKILNRDDFVILKQGESYSLEKNKIVQVYDGTKNTEDDLRVGRYTLQIKVGTWYYSPSIIDKYRKGWQSQGFLWTSDITSIPMEFDIEDIKKRLIVSCH
jgi:hypothetical protein